MRRFLYVAGSLVIAGTLYLRYHYVVDLLAGAVLAAWSVATTRRVATLVAGRVRTLPLAS